jgi:hypothetical protein
MRESKKIEKFVDKIQKQTEKQMRQIMKSIKDLDGNDLNEYRRIAVGFKECLEKIFKQQDDVIAVYDTNLTDWTSIYNKEQKKIKSLHRYLSMWFVSRRLFKLEEKLSMAYCVEDMLEFVMDSIDEIIKMIDKRLESEK